MICNFPHKSQFGCSGIRQSGASLLLPCEDHGIEPVSCFIDERQEEADAVKELLKEAARGLNALANTMGENQLGCFSVRRHLLLLFLLRVLQFHVGISALVLDV